MNIKKCYNLFIKTVHIGMEKLKISAFVICMAMSAISWRKQVQIKIQNLPFHISDLVLSLIYIIMFIILFVSLYGILKITMKKEFDILISLGITKSEFYVISFLRLNYILYLYILLCILLIKTDYFGVSLPVFFIFIIGGITYALIYTAAFFINYRNIFTGNNLKKYFINYDLTEKINDRYYKEDKTLFLSRLKLDMAFRHKISSLVLLKCILGILSIFFAFTIKSAPICTVINIIFILLLILSNDMFWKCESKNVTIYRYMGLKYNKYIVIKIIGCFLFSSDIFLIITLITTGKISHILIIASITILLSIYWSIILSSIFCNKNSQEFHDLVIIGYIFIMFVPVIPLIITVTNYKKCLLLWEGGE